MIDNNNITIKDEDVAVIGIGLRFPSGNLNESISTPKRWSDNYSITGEITSKYAGLLPLDEWCQFDRIFFALNPSEDHISSIDPQQRLLLKCVWNALKDSGLIQLVYVVPIQVPIGASTVDYCNLQRSPFETENNIFGSTTHSVANRISFVYDFRGESLTIDTACSSSLNAINYPHISKSFTQLGLLIPTGKCHTFSSDTDGYVRSEGVGIVVLKNLKQAIKDHNQIYCVIKGGNSNVDGNYDELNFYSPPRSSQYENIKAAIKSTNGQVHESDIDYCECHGTGTPTGDPIECEGISRVFTNTPNDKQVLIGSIKSNIGHTEACFFKISTFNEPNPSIKFDEWKLKVITKPIKFNQNKNTTMLINNFGVTGSNGCLILSEFKNENDEMDIDIKQEKKYLIPLCANSSTSLDSYKSILIRESQSLDFNQFVNNQIKYKPTSLIQKSVVIASNWNDFTAEKKKSPVTVVVLCGQGSQYNNMALSLYENEAVFRNFIDRFDRELYRYYGYSVLKKLRSTNEKDMITTREPILAQPANVMIQVSLYELYKHWGVKPDIIVGHSLGEVSSPYCSGMIDFETLCYLIYHRSVAQNKTTGTGRMLSVNIGPDEFIKTYSSRYPSLEIACYNSPSSIVIAGKETLLKQITTEFKSNGIFCAMLGSLSSFHTSSQLMIKDEIYSLNIKFKPPVFSTVTTNLFNYETSPFNAQYVFDNIIQQYTLHQQ